MQGKLKTNTQAWTTNPKGLRKTSDTRDQLKKDPKPSPYEKHLKQIAMQPNPEEGYPSVLVMVQIICVPELPPWKNHL